MYAVQCTIETSNGDYRGVRQLPTFYLDERVQGITDEGHAARIARDIILPVGQEATLLHVTAVKL